jgi:hypothetical protein
MNSRIGASNIEDLSISEIVICKSNDDSIILIDDEGFASLTLNVKSESNELISIINDFENKIVNILGNENSIIKFEIQNLKENTIQISVTTDQSNKTNYLLLQGYCSESLYLPSKFKDQDLFELEIVGIDGNWKCLDNYIKQNKYIVTDGNIDINLKSSFKFKLLCQQDINPVEFSESCIIGEYTNSEECCICKEKYNNKDNTLKLIRCGHKGGHEKCLLDENNKIKISKCPTCLSTIKYYFIDKM